MKNFKFMAVAAGLLIVSAPAALFAQDKSDTKSADKPGPELREKLQKMTPEERKDFMKNHPELAKQIQQRRGIDFEKRRAVMERAGLKADDMKDLSPADRQKKVRETVDKRVADLEKKKADGTALTEQEQEDLDTLKQMKATFGGSNGQGGPRRHPKSDKPASSDTK